MRDAKAAVAYLKSRPDADPRGVGFFGISKGAGAGLFAAAHDPYVRCCVTDGVFAVYTTLVPYMRHWFRIYNKRILIQGLIPSWFFGLIGLTAVRRCEQRTPLPFPAPGTRSAPIGIAAAAHDPRRQRHLHQAGHGAYALSTTPATPRNCGSSKAPSTTRP